MRHSSDTTKQVMQDVSHAVSAIIHKVIAFAPVGIFGLVAVTFADAGLATLESLCTITCCSIRNNAVCCSSD